MAQPTRLLMSRPLSVLTRPDQSLQIGLDCDDAVLLGDAPEGADAAVRAFRSPHSAADVSRLLPELATGWLSAAVETLTRRGVLAEAPRARRACRVLGEGPLATEVLRLLRMEGVPLLEPDASP
ncbi:MAG: hypothetical protein Q4F65_10320, partial [Propionibacteriaceae bacterium]|nr:hypothetical protein [Propionibacteriaceae bacterium]